MRLQERAGSQCLSGNRLQAGSNTNNSKVAPDVLIRLDRVYSQNQSVRDNGLHFEVNDSGSGLGFDDGFAGAAGKHESLLERAIADFDRVDLIGEVFL